MPATLCIWPNAKGPMAASTPGHAALDIEHEGRHEYISWWPTAAGKAKPFKKREVRTKTWEQDVYAEMGVDTRRKLQEGNFKPRWGQFRMTLRFEDGPRQVWVQGPHHRVILPGAGEGETGIGLNLQRIIEWWQVFQKAQNASYRFVSKTMNCASVIGTALIAGGADLYAAKKFDDMSWGWFTPLDVLKFGEEVNKGIERIIVHVETIRKREPAYGMAQMPLGARQKMAPVDWQASRSENNRREHDLMPYATWVTLSDRNIKKFMGYARRKDQVAKIDKLLQEYHNQPWLAGDPPAGNWKAKVQLLHEMLKQVHDHMREKAESDRAEAVFILGKQLVEVLDRYGDLV